MKNRGYSTTPRLRKEWIKKVSAFVHKTNGSKDQVKWSFASSEGGSATLHLRAWNDKRGEYQQDWFVVGKRRGYSTILRWHGKANTHADLKRAVGKIERYLDKAGGMVYMKEYRRQR